MFTDLRGFTTFAETLTPDRVIEVLNRYLSEMSDAILDHGGTLVAYMGDGIMAVFGAPIEQADHADRALAAAREMLDRAPAALQRVAARAGSGPGFRMGIGLNSGRVMSGNVGSERRVEYTAVGDTTNIGRAHRAADQGNTPPADALGDDQGGAHRRRPRISCSWNRSSCAAGGQHTTIWSLRRRTRAEKPEPRAARARAGQLSPRRRNRPGAAPRARFRAGAVAATALVACA